MLVAISENGGGKNEYVVWKVFKNTKNYGDLQISPFDLLSLEIPDLPIVNTPSRI